MILISLFIFSSVLWQEDFTDTISTMSQLFDYTIDITHEDGKVFLRAHPQCGGITSAWFYIDEDLTLSDDILELVMKVNDNKALLRYFYRKEGGGVYFFGDKIVSADTQWQRVQIPLEEAKPFYGSDFPYALTPGKMPCLYIFIQNKLQGNFDVEIDGISVLRMESPEEEK